MSALQRLLARFDLEVLRPPPGRGAARDPDGTAARAHAAWPGLLAWCRGPAPLSIARVDGADAAMLSEALMRELDGSQALEACRGRAAGLTLRLGVKLREALGADPAGLPWDAGWLRDDDAAAQRLGQAFQPRRPTLIVVDGVDPARLGTALAGLQTRSTTLTRPLRLLLVGAQPGPAAADQTIFS